MSIASDAAKHRPATLTHSIQPGADWRVKSVEVLPDYCLKVRFMEGLEGVVRMKDLVWSPHAGVFESLRDPEMFGQVGVVWGAVTWANGLDLAPDAMYDEIKTHGVWVLS